jgi:hypothetical protein
MDSFPIVFSVGLFYVFLAFLVIATIALVAVTIRSIIRYKKHTINRSQLIALGVMWLIGGLYIFSILHKG